MSEPILRLCIEKFDKIAGDMMMYESSDSSDMQSLLEGIKATSHDVSSVSHRVSMVVDACIKKLSQSSVSEDDFIAVGQGIEAVMRMLNVLLQGARAETILFPESLGLKEEPVKNSRGLSDDVDEEMLVDFISNAEDLLGEIESYALSVDENPSEWGEIKSAMMRDMHTLKGDVGVLGVSDFSSVCHCAETLLEASDIDDLACVVDRMLRVRDWLLMRLAQMAGKISELDETSQDIEKMLDVSCLLKNKNAGKIEKKVDIEDVSEAQLAPSVANLIANESSSSEDGEIIATPGYSEPLIVEINDDDVPLLLEFISETNEHLENSDDALLSLESDPKNQELLGVVFRAFHTVKGVASFLNLIVIRDLAHRAETLLDKARSGLLVLEGPLIDLMFESVSYMRKLLEGTQQQINGETPEALPGIFPFIKTLEVAVENALKDEGGATPSQASVGKPQLTPLTEAESATDAMAEIDRILAGDAPLIPVEAPKIETEGAENLDYGTHEIATGIEVAVVKDKKTATSKKFSSTRSKASDFIKIPTDRLDSLIELVGELVIAHLMVSQDEVLKNTKDVGTQKNVKHLGKITRDLQGLSMAMRMVPIKPTFQKMTRLIRDLAKKAGKHVRLELSGEDTELDRNIIGIIGDPLVHMMRNCVDHGLETPQERIATGKDEQGIVKLCAYHQGGSIVVEVVDDGRGLSLEKIKEKAFSRGIISEDDKLSDSQIYNLIFEPGFSTAASITDLSGRGVGMDVVKRNIESMRGRVEIDSTPGKGTRFFLSLPLTLAIIDGMVVSVNSHRYIIPTVNILESIQIDEEALGTVSNKAEMLMVRNELVALHRLSSVFVLGDTDTDEVGVAIIVESAGKHIAVMVDSILGQQQVVIKSLGEELQAVPGISGGAIMGDGQIALIIDVAELIQVVEE